MAAGSVVSRQWHKIPLLAAELKLDLTLACGQSFRWQEVSPGVWSSVLAGRVWFLSQTPDELMYQVWHPEDITASNVSGTDNETLSTNDLKDFARFDKTHSVGCVTSESISSVIKSETVVQNEHIETRKIGSRNGLKDENILRDYFQLDVSVQDLYRKWCDCDPVFRELAGSFSGIRILRQDPVENLFSFICSSNNHISRISSMVEKLCEHYGPQIGTLNGKSYYGFPNAESLAAPGVEDKLRSLGFGYRAKYISISAQFIQQQSPDWLMGLRERPYEEAKKELMKLTGVGAKVADCVCLMSLDKHGAIPVDTHVWQFAARDYMPKLKQCKSLTDTVYKSIGDFFRNLWGEYAGWAQSVLFSADLKKFQDRKVKSVGGQSMGPVSSEEKYKTTETAGEKKKAIKSVKRKTGLKLDTVVDCTAVKTKQSKSDKSLDADKQSTKAVNKKQRNVTKRKAMNRKK